MSQNAMKRLYLMQVGSMPEYQIPIVCYLVQTGDGKHILIDSGLPEIMPEGESEFENGQDVIEQLASIGLKPDDIDTVISTHYDIDHAGRHAAFTKAHYVVQRVHHVDAASNPRFAANRPQWDQPMERIRLVDGDTELLPGLLRRAGMCRDINRCWCGCPKRGRFYCRLTLYPSARALPVTSRTTVATRTPKRSAPVR